MNLPESLKTTCNPTITVSLTSKDLRADSGRLLEDASSDAESLTLMET